MTKISLVLMVCSMIAVSCACQEPVIIEEPLPRERLPGPVVKSPRYPSPYADEFVLKVLNGLGYQVNINLTSEEIVEITPGGQADIPFLKSYYSRQVVLTGIVLSEERQVIGTTRPKKIRVPSKERVSLVEEVWYITSFRRLRR